MNEDTTQQSGESNVRAVVEVTAGAASIVTPPTQEDTSPTKDMTEESGLRSPNGAAASAGPTEGNVVAATTTENNTVTIQVRPTSSFEDQPDAEASSSGAAAAITRIEINGANIKDAMEQDKETTSANLAEEDDDDDDESGSDISSVVNAPSVISQTPDRYGFHGGEQYTHER